LEEIGLLGDAEGMRGLLRELVRTGWGEGEVYARAGEGVGGRVGGEAGGVEEGYWEVLLKRRGENC
jgi:hypothetical protein